jgi:hypothetical protein
MIFISSNPEDIYSFKKLFFTIIILMISVKIVDFFSKKVERVIKEKKR